MFALKVVLLGAFLCCTVMYALWSVHKRNEDAGIVDVGWALCLAILAIHYMLIGPGDSWRRIMVGTLGGIWGMRLAAHLWFDRVQGKEENGRYQRLRDHWGERANRNFFWFFQAQAMLAVVLSTPFLLASWGGEIGASAVFAGWLWLIALLGESLADRQLAAWRNDPLNRGKTCRAGLWKYSRHPNYFCEWLIWISYALLAHEAPHGWLAWISPAIMLVLILFVTGIPYNEAQALRSRGDDYREYQRTTSAFLPWFPKR